MLVKCPKELVMFLSFKYTQLPEKVCVCVCVNWTGNYRSTQEKIFMYTSYSLLDFSSVHEGDGTCTVKISQSIRGGCSHNTDMEMYID